MDEPDHPSDTNPPSAPSGAESTAESTASSPSPGRERLRWRKKVLVPRVDADGNPLPPETQSLRAAYMKEYARKRRAQLKAGAPKHGKPGRPRQPGLENRFEPTPEQREIVRLLVGMGITHDRIVKCVRNPATRRPIGVHTLERAFADELDCGSAELDALACGMLAKRIREGNIVALIWYMKNRMGWADQREVHTRSDMELKVELKPDELARELEAHGLPQHVFGCDKPTLEIAPPRSTNGHDPDDGGGAVGGA